MMRKGSFQRNFSKAFILLLLNFISRTIKQMRLKAPNASRKGYQVPFVLRDSFCESAALFNLCLLRGDLGGYHMRTFIFSLIIVDLLQSGGRRGPSITRNLGRQTEGFSPLGLSHVSVWERVRRKGLEKGTGKLKR